MTVDRQRGSAVVEFVGVGILVTLCTLGILQTAMIAHVRAVLTDSAIAGAAHAALANSSLGAGTQRARASATASIPQELVDAVVASREVVAGRDVVVVTIRYRFPPFGPWVAGAQSSVSGRAFVEVA